MSRAYRPVPRAAEVVAVAAWTAPLGVWRAVALVLLLLGGGAALVPQAAVLACVQQPLGPACVLSSHRVLVVQREPVDLVGLRGVSTTADPDLPLRRALMLRALESEGVYLPLPTRGIHRDAAGAWHDDGQLVERARVFFRGRRGAFAVVQRGSRPVDHAMRAMALLGPLGALLALWRAERQTRRLGLTVDLNLRVARGRSVGFGGRSMAREMAFAPGSRLLRTDEADAPHRPFVRVAGADGASTPLLTGHHPAHAASFDALVDRVHRALAAGADDGAGADSARRLGPSVLLALAAMALGLRALVGVSALPDVSGQVAVTSTAPSCEVEGLTLRRGGYLSWSAPVGQNTTRTVSAQGPDGRPVQAPVRFEVAPGRTSTFDCARLVREPVGVELRVSPERD